MEKVWAICWNGPAKGTVAEVPATQPYLQVRKKKGTFDGVHIYLRTGWCEAKEGHFIARFGYTRTLVS